MAVMGIAGSTDGIGRAAARAASRRAPRLVHARSRERGEPVAKALGGDVALVVGDLARIDDVRRLADQAREHGPIDAWVRRYRDDPCVIVLAPHLLTQLSAELQRWLLWLGSGVAGSARRSPRPLAGRPIRGGRTPRVRRATLPWPWLGIVGCRTSSRLRSTRGGSRPRWPVPAPMATSARRRTLSPSAARHPTWPRRPTGRPGADAGPRTAAGPRPPGCDLRGLRSDGRCRLRPTTRAGYAR